MLAEATHTAPDRPPEPNGDVEFRPEGLYVSKAARVVVTDTTYADVEIAAETPAGTLPQVELGTLTVGGSSCLWPSATGPSFAITRAGTSFQVAVADQATTCEGPAGRVSVALRGPLREGRALVTKLRVTRQ
jgi:hypothetical protein